MDGYSDIEQDFFRAGDEMTDEVIEVEPAPKQSLWSRLFERRVRMPSEVSFVAPGPAREPEDDDEWDWVIAVARARARHATQPGI